MQREEIEMNIWQLQNWFDTYYAQHEQKFRRLIALGKKTDEGADANIELTKLYVEAEEKRKKIQELEKNA